MDDKNKECPKNTNEIECIKQQLKKKVDDDEKSYTPSSHVNIGSSDDPQVRSNNSSNIGGAEVNEAKEVK